MASVETMEPSMSKVVKSLENKMELLLAQFQAFTQTQETQHEEVLLLIKGPRFSRLSKSSRESGQAFATVVCNSSHDVLRSDEEVNAKKSLKVPPPLWGRMNSALSCAENDISGWVGEVKNRQDMESKKSAKVKDVASEFRHTISVVPSVLDMQAAFEHCVASNRSPKSECQRTPEDPRPSPPEEPQLPLIGSIPATEKIKDTDSPRRDSCRCRDTTDSPRWREGQEIENMMSLSKRSHTHIMDLYSQPYESSTEPLDCGVYQDLGCRISVNLPRFALGVPVLLAALATSLLYCWPLGCAGSGHAFTTDVASAVFSFFAVACLYFLRHAILSPDMALAVKKLQLFLDSFTTPWARRCRQEQRRSLVVWLILLLTFVSEQVCEAYRAAPGSMDEQHLRVIVISLSALSFALSSGMVVLVAYVQQHFLLGLDTSVDCWCCSLLEEPDFSLGVDSWNCLQALLKCIGRELASSFLAVQVLGAGGFIYLLASTVTALFQHGLDMEMLLPEGLKLLPLLVYFMLEMRVFSRGASLTQKCRVVPSFVNQIPSATLLDTERQYLVRFVEDSSAGFQVRDVQLTPEMFLKIFIFFGGLVSGLIGILSRVSLS
ncbi:unnamed protein product [Effrenium voratum]|nr:unnamed protein product [Effrenium voratum]